MVCVAWVFFRAESVREAFDFLGKTCDNFESISTHRTPIPYIIFLFAAETMLSKFLSFHWIIRYSTYAICVLLVLYHFVENPNPEFIYFDF